MSIQIYDIGRTWRNSVGTASRAQNSEGVSTSQSSGKVCCKQDSDIIMLCVSMLLIRDKRLQYLFRDERMLIRYSSSKP